MPTLINVCRHQAILKTYYDNFPKASFFPTNGCIFHHMLVSKTLFTVRRAKYQKYTLVILVAS